MGGVEFAKELVKANATVDKEDVYGLTALSYAVKKIGNLMSEKRPRNMCKGVAFSVVTLPTRYRRILPLPPLLPLPLLQCVGDASFDPLFVVVVSQPGKWYAIRESRFVPKLGQQKPLFPGEKKRASVPFCLRLRRKEGKECNCAVASIALVWDVWDPLLLSLISLVFFLVVGVAVCVGEEERVFSFFPPIFI